MAKRKVDTSQALFTDFSTGLYLLDTPRGYGEQLSSLALIGGRNVWSEKGALVPQYGYDIKATIPNNEKILCISEDDAASSSIFIITKDIESNAGNVYLYTAKSGLKQYKTVIPSIEEPIITARNGNSLILRTAGVNYYFGSYYSESPENEIDTNLDISTYTTYYETTIPEESLPYYWEGKEVVIKTTDKNVPVKVVSITNTETTINQPVKVSTLKSYVDNNKEVVITVPFALDSLDKTVLTPIVTGMESDGDWFVGYMQPTNQLRVRIHGKSGDTNKYGTITFDESFSEAGAKYEFKIFLNYRNNTTSVELYKNGAFLDTVSDKQSLAIFKDLFSVQYADKEINSNAIVTVDGKVVSSIQEPACKLRMTVLTGNAHITITEKINLVEQTIHTLTFQYKPEEVSETNPNINITPEVMGFCANRLCISDVSGRIYYSGVGVVDNFEQAMGAGFFEGFSDDNSKCLALEDYYNGVLITKQNGLYFLAFGVDSTDSVSAGSTIGISIKKIAQIGQEYAKDHVIVDKQILAYDSNSASLLVAAAVNVFGSLVAGKTLVDAEGLNATNFGIPDQKRTLVYNSEAKVLILYYGEQLKNGIVYVPSTKAIFPRELDLTALDFQGFNQGTLGVSEDGKIFQDYKKGTIIENLTGIANFEAIGLRDNRMICGSLLEISELNNIEYDLTVSNTQVSLQHIAPNTSMGTNGISTKNLPPMIYSNKKNNSLYNSFSTQRKWADKMSNCTRVYAPMSGRYGVSLSFEFPKSEAFCLAAILIPDFSQGS
jgi:hypothetical protein